MKKQTATDGVLKHMLREMTHERAFLVTLIMSPIAALLLGTLVPFFMSRVIANVVGSGHSFHAKDFIALVVVGIGGILCNRLAFGKLMQAQTKTLERVQDNCLDSLLQKSAAFFDNRMSGKITTDSINYVESFMSLQDVIVVQILPFITNILAGVLIVGYFSVVLGLGIALLSTLAIASAIYASKRRKHLRAARIEASRKLRGYFADIVTNNATVRLFANEKIEKTMHKKLNKDLSKKRLHDWTLITKDGNNRILAIFSMQMLFLFVLSKFIANDPAFLGIGIFAFSYTLSVSNKLFEVNGMMRGFENALSNAEPMVRILEEEAEIKDTRLPQDLHITQAEIVFSNVLFWYEDSSQPLFHNLNLRITPGEKVGLVGPSGGGKTTLTKLLLRLTDIKDGSIEIDGQNITQTTAEQLRKAISYVPQDPMLFHRTIAENVSYGNPRASKEKLLAVCKDAHIHDFIESLPQGYDTLVGERGVKLSGGQRQRVAIARAMLKNAPILVLDEATSALDSESEVLIQDALWKLMKNKTTVVIAHRLSTIQKMDRILVLENGEIIEQGTHSELKEAGGLYATLWSHQSGGFLQEE